MCAMSGCTTGAGSGCVAAGREECRRWLPVMSLLSFCPHTLFGETHPFVRLGTRGTGRLQVEVNVKKTSSPTSASISTPGTWSCC